MYFYKFKGYYFTYFFGFFITKKCTVLELEVECKPKNTYLV